MNKHLYRIIFNQRRGQMMVVAENAPSSGKAASGESDAAGAGPLGALATALRPIYVAVCAALGVAVLAAGPSYAQLKADPNAPGNQRPTVLQTSNGVPLVNIQTPSAAGVSRNTYSQFDITNKGAVLNNSRTDVQSQIGGWVQGNPWLAAGTARVILNEVNSSNPSQLRGYVEVAGQRAEVIIANPAGVQIDGGGFINASRVTITTGTAQMNSGSLDSFLVQNGTVTINGLGLDASQTDFTSILARALQLNAGIWAKELQVVTGVNQIAAASGAAITPVAATGAAPVFALDVAHLGGMYAGKITMIGTEAGLGVRNAGVLAAASGNLVLDANGWLSNSGSLQATGQGANASIRTAGSIANTGTVYAADTSVTSAADITGNGMIAAGNHTTIAAARINAGAGAVLAAGMNADGSLGASGDLRVSATTGVALHGTGAAAGNIDIKAGQLDLSGARVFGDQVALAATEGSLNASRATLSTPGALSLGAAHMLRTDAAQVAAGQLVIGAHDLSNVGGRISQSGSGDLTLALPGALDNTLGQIASNSGNLTLNASTLLNTGGAIAHAGTGTLAINAATLSGQHGQISGNGGLAITATEIDHRGAAAGAQRIAINATNLNNQGGAISQTGAGTATLAVNQALENSAGRIESSGSANIAAATLLNNDGRITAAGAGTISALTLDNTNGTIATDDKLSIAGTDIDNTDGSLQSLGGAATLHATVLNNARGSIYARGNVDTIAVDAVNSGSMYAAGDVNLTVSGSLTNSGVIAAHGNTTISANSLTGTAGSLLGAGVKPNGVMAPTGNLSVATAEGLAAHGQNIAAGSASLTGATVDVSGSQTSAGNVALQATAGNVTTANALVASSASLAVTTGNALVNTGGTLSAGQLSLDAASLSNTQGSIIQTGAGDTVIALAGTLDNTAGRIAVNSTSLTLNANALRNTDGVIEHAGTGTLAIGAANLSGARGAIIGNSSLVIAAGALNNDGASTSARSIDLKASSMSNRAGQLLQSGAGSMTLDVTGQLDNSRGEIAGAGQVAAHTGALENHLGRITSGRSADISSHHTVNNTAGVIAAAEALTVSAQVVDNTGGAIQAGTGALTLTTATLLNAQGTLSSGASLTASTGGDLRNDGVLYSGGDQTLNVGGTFTNVGSVAAKGDVSIAADKIHSDAGSLLAAGVNADGSFSAAGNLTLNALDTLQANGTVLAAGNAVLGGASVDLHGSQAAAGNIAITARSGSVSTANAQIGTAGTLSVTAAQALDNREGSLAGGQLSLNGAGLNNGHGAIIQSGAGDTAIALNGMLDNTSGRIAVNSANLMLGAATFVNTDGRIEHAGAGTLAINAVTLDGQRGQIIANGALDIVAGAIDHRGAASAAQRIAISAASLDNSGGQIAQLGNGAASISVNAILKNHAGAIESNGDTVIAVATLDNSGGRIAAVSNVGISANSALNNTAGAIVAGADLAISGGDVDNASGSLQAIAGDATLVIADLNNAAGSIYAAGNLSTMADNVTNTGNLYAAGDQNLAASGTLANSGVIAAQGSTTIGANVVSSGVGSLLAAGLKADGSLAQSGNLSVTAVQGLSAAGQTLAAGSAVLTGASLDLSGGRTSAASLALNASAGSITTAGATTATAGTLTMSATQSLVNTGGTISAGQLVAQVADLDNTQGTIIQTGIGATAMTVGGTINNTAGRIAVNSASLALGAGTLINTDGAIEHAGSGTLAIAAANLNGARGSIIGNGDVNINAGAFNHNGATTYGQNVVVQSATLDNRGGHLLQGGAGTITLDVTGQLDNAGGEIAGNGNLAVNAGAIDNDHGRMTSASSVDLTSQAALNNTDGVLAAGQSLTASAQALDNTRGQIQANGAALTVSAASLLNDQGTLSASTDLSIATSGNLTNAGVMYAGRDQAVTAGGVLNNTGSIAAQRDTTVAAGSVASGAASLLGAGVKADGSLAQSGNLTVNALGAMQAAGNVLAKGDLAVSGASVDLGGSETNAANIAITATGGNVNTAQTDIGTVGTLNISAAQTIDNHQGRLSAGQIVLNAANLNNDHGVIIQSGTGDTNISMGGTLDNTSGRIAVNSNSLAIAAATLLNTDGKIEHAGTGTLAINAATLGGQRGQITGNGALSIVAGGIDHRDAITSAQRITIAATNLDNSSGQISHLGDATASITASGNLDNSAGAIEGNGNVAVVAATLDNSGGRIAGVGNAGVAAGTSLNNTAGFIAGGAHLSVSGGNVDNTGGTLQAQAGNATLTIANLNNTGGTVYASGNLATTAADVTNSGSMYAAGSQNVTASGALVNTGTIAAQGGTTISANTLTSGSSSLLAAGLKADGTLAQSGNLSVNTTHALLATGQNLAAGSATLAGGLVNIGGSQTGAASVSLTASAGNVTTSDATVATTGTLAVTAGQSLINARGTLSGGQLVVQVAGLDNTDGAIIQTGTGDTAIAMTGTLNNTDGRISVNSANLTLGADTLINADGVIEHAGAGTLAIAAGTLNGERGTIVGNGGVSLTAGAFIHNGASTSGQRLDVQATSLSNRAGQLLQSGAGSMTLNVSGQLDNTLGDIGANGALTVQAGALDNIDGSMTSAAAGNVTLLGSLNNTDGVIAAAQTLDVAAQALNNRRGEIQAQTGALTVDTASLINTGGTLSSGTDMATSTTGDLLNDGTLYAGRDQTVSVGGTFTNAGSIAAQGNTTVSAGTILSGADSLLGAGIKRDGSLAQTGNLTVTAVNNLQAAGTNLAAGSAVLSGASVDLGGSDTNGANIAIIATSGDVNTALTRIVTPGTLSISAAQTLGNSGGTLSANQLSLDAANLNNNAGTIVQTGTGNTSIALGGTLDNTAGRIAVNSSNLTLAAGTLVNTDGAIEHAGAGTLTINATTLSGQRGDITGNGALAITAGAIDHRDAITMAQSVAITASSLDNRDGQITHAGAGSASIAVSGNLDNRAGAIESNSNALVSAATLDNSTGRIAATGNVSVNVGTALINSAGFIAGGANLNVSGGNVDNAGGTLQALAGNATLTIADLSNTGGHVYASGNLATTAVNVTNTGSMYAAGSQSLAASGALTNTSVIAAQGNTTISAGTLSSGANSLLAAGLDADGVLGQTGNLSVTASNGLTANGQNLAAGSAALTGATVNLSGSQTSAANITLGASAGSITTTDATVATVGTLSLAASDSLVNLRGTVSAGQLVAQVAGLDNTQGSIVQTGAANTILAMGGTLNNTQGVIAVNSANLTLGAGTLVNTDGAIEHAGAGALAITAATLNGERGTILGNGSVNITTGAFDHDGATLLAESVTVQASSLSNRAGEVLQTGAGAMTLNVSGQVDNTSGDIGGNGALALQAGSLDNSTGSITSADAATVVVAGALNNTDGVIHAAHVLGVSSQALDNTRGAIQAGDGALTLNASSVSNNLGTLSAGTDLIASTTGNLLNNGVLYAGRDQTLNVAGTFTNLTSAAALRDLTVTAGSVASGAGSLLGAGIRTDGALAQSGNLVVNAAGKLQAGGTNLAAGNAALTGASVDLTGSQTGADNVTISATNGGVTTSLAMIGTPGALSISASQALDNHQGTLSAGQLSLSAASLNNVDGDIVQSGTADATIGVAGTLDNTSGRIAVNSANLTLGAATLVNLDGAIEHAGSGTLAINATILSGLGGQITGNGTLAITSGNVDLRDASTAAQRITIAATSLDNRGGQIVQLGNGSGSIAVSGNLDNRAGAIDSYGSATVSAATLDNSGGRIAAAGGLGVNAGVLNNTAGAVIGGTSLAVSGGNLNNTSGSLQAQAGSATLNVADLNNADGSVYASANLSTTATSLTNSGSMYAGASQSMSVSGALVNTGAIAALGNTTISADNLSSGANSLLAAGMNLDGSMAQTGNLSVTTTQALATNGQNIAAGTASLTASSVKLSAGQTSAGNITLNATTGNVTTTDAAVATAGTLSITAAQSLINTRGTLSAGQLLTQVDNLDNAQGTIIQTGAGNTTINVSGTLDNTAGRIAVNSANLTLGAPTVINAGGSIEHAGAGTLAINATTLNNASGQITSNGSLNIVAGGIDHTNASTLAQQITISAASLDNRQGDITQLGAGVTTIGVSGALDNRAGVIASNGATAISTGSLNNQGGVLQAAGSAALNVSASGTLDNTGGQIASGGSATLSGNVILNQLGEVSAGGALSATAVQGIHNVDGMLVANGDIGLTGATLDNTGGQVASVLGDVNVTTSGAVDNDSGVIQAAGNVGMDVRGLSNSMAAGYARAGVVMGNNVRIENGPQTLDNRLGTIAATLVLEANSGATNNDGGLLQAGSALYMGAGVLTNTNAALHAGSPGGIVSGGTLSMHSSSWNNAAGFLGAGGAISITGGAVSNTLGGQIVGEAGMFLESTGLDNRGGQFQMAGDLMLEMHGAAIDNRGGLIRTGGAMTVYADQVDNRNTNSANQGLEGARVTVNADVLLNAAGAIRAEQEVSIASSGSVDNTQGLISGGTFVGVTDFGTTATLSLTNTGGTIIGGQSTSVRAASMTNDGRLLSLGNLQLYLNGDYTNTNAGEITANGNASLNFSGNLYNTGTLQAGGTLSVSAVNINNSASGTIEGYGTKLTAVGTLTNRGVIDGVFTELNALTLNNIGTGKIYGDYVSIAAGSLTNEAEADVGATIAARQRLDIGARMIWNRDHALILSGGDMAIGFGLDGNRLATGNAYFLNNNSATIEALGNMRIGADDINNINIGTDSYYVEGEPKPIEEWSCQVGTGYQCQYDGDAGGGRYPGYWVDADSNPARISAGGTLTISAANILNDDSQILAGGLLNIGTATLNNSGASAQSQGDLAGGGVASQGKLPGAASTNAVSGSTGALGALVAAVSNAVIAKTNAAADVVGAAAGNLAGNAVGTGGLNGSTRNEGAGATGQAGGAAGAQAAANGAAGVAGTAGATSLQAGGVGVANRQANAAVGVNGLSNSDRADGVGQSGLVGAVAGALAAHNGGANGTGSASPAGLQLSSVSVANRLANAALGVDGLDGSDRAENAGQNGSVAAASGALAATNSGANGAGSAAAMVLQAASAAVNGRQAGAAAGVDVELGGLRSGVVAAVLRAVDGRQAGEAAGSNGPDHAVLAVAPGADTSGTAGITAKTATAAVVPAVARVGNIDQVTLSNPTGGAQIVRTTEPDTRIPRASLYSVDASRASYLIETDARFANYRQWLGSDYMMDQLQLDPAVTQKRLGDGYYEQSLVRAQVAQLTGRRFLGDFTSDDDEYRALMDAGVAYAKSLNLRPGLALSAAQMAVLSSDIVWLVEQDVALADGSVQRVLVPKVYVRVRDGDVDGSGGLLSGKDVDINVTGNLVNTGTIAGRDVVRLTADNVNNLAGRIHGNGVMIEAKTDLNNIGGTISANKALVATAGRDINIESTTGPSAGMSGKVPTSGTAIDRVAGLYVTGEGGTLLASAGRDVKLLAGQIGNAGADGTTVISAGRNIDLGTVTETTSKLEMQNAGNYRKETTTTEVGSQVVSAGSLALKAGADINLRAAAVQAGGALTAQAGNDINIVAGMTTTTVDIATQKKKKGFLKSKTTTTRNTTETNSAIASNLSGAMVALTAGQDVTFSGSNASAAGALRIDAGRDLNVVSAQQIASASASSQTTKRGLSASFLDGVSYGKASAGQAQTVQGVTQAGSTLSGGSIETVSGRDTTVGASMLLADGSVSVAAGRNLQILSAANTEASKSQANSSSTSIGLVGGLSGRFTNFGKSKSAQDGDGTSITQITSVLSANGGNLTLTAGGDSQYKGTGQGTLLTQGADLLAKGVVAMSANAVDLQAVIDGGADRSHSESKSLTIGSALTGTVGGAITRLGDMTRDAQNTDNGRLKGALALKAGYDAYKLLAGSGEQGADGASASGASAPSADGTAFGVSVSINSSKSRQDSSSSNAYARGTSAQGGKISITSLEGDIAMTGAKLQATDVHLESARDILLQAAENSTTTQSSNKSSSVGAGATLGVGQQTGLSFQLSASQGKGHTNGSETTYDNTMITATNVLSVKSEGDTTLKGAQLVGDKVVTDIGGNLALQTLQDKSTTDSKQTSSGFAVSVCIPPICVGTAVTASVNYARQKINHDYQSATGQTGIAAGAGGYDIKVAGNTDLQGAAITSDAPSEQNRLQTQSLSSSDLENHQNTAASSISLSLSTGASMASNLASNALSNLVGNAGLPKNGSESSTTQSVISPGQIVITGDDPQSRQTADKLTGRDAATANGALSNTLTLQQAAEHERDQQRVQENQRAAEAVSAVMTNVIGDVAQSQGWATGSTEKLVLHGLAGVIGAKVSGGSALVGASAAVMNEAMIPMMADYLVSQGISAKSQQFDDLMKAGSTLVGAATGALVAGNLEGAATGANVALTATTNNFLGHKDRERRDHLRKKAATDPRFSKDEKAELVNLEIADQFSDEFLNKYRSGATLTADERYNLNFYLDRYQKQDGTENLQALIKNGPTPTYAFPYAGSTKARQTYADAKRAANNSGGLLGTTWAFLSTSIEHTPNNDLFTDAMRESGMGGSFPGGLNDNDAYLPSAQRYSAFNSRIDSIRNSAILVPATYAVGKLLGVDDANMTNAMVFASGASDVLAFASMAANRQTIKPVIDTQDVWLGYSGKPATYSIGPANGKSSAVDAKGTPEVDTNATKPPPVPNFIATSNGDVGSTWGKGPTQILAIERELKVAEMTGGRSATVHRYKDGVLITEDTPIKRNGVVVSGIDVFGKNGELIQVGGPMKNKNDVLLEKTKRSLEALKSEAAARNTVAQVYYEQGNSARFQQLIVESKKILGENNVFVFPPKGKK